MPPVLNVAFDELARCRKHDLGPGKLRGGMDECPHVLKLVTKSEGSS